MERTRHIDATVVSAALRRLEHMRAGWLEASGVGTVLERAERLLAVHPLTAADALQLGAALDLLSGRPKNHRFVTSDERLAKAAGREGFDAVVPSS